MASTRVFTGHRAFKQPPRRAVVTVGVFDGVHRGHQHIIRSAVALSRHLGGTSLAITFNPDPQQVLDPAHAQPALMPLETRTKYLRELGLERIWIIPFTTRFARVSAEEFIRRILIHRLHAVALVVGERFVFGRNREGDMDVLQRLGPVHGLRVVPVRELRDGRKPISSSRIRRLIAQGELAGARGLLGRSPELHGVVVRGAGRGRRLGFPTANIRLRAQILPPRGVYAVIVRSLGSGRIWRGVMNLGIRPTFGLGPLVCEVHLPGFSGSLLGQSVSVSLLSRLRSERCFPSISALRAQIHRDLHRARQLFTRLA